MDKGSRRAACQRFDLGPFETGGGGAGKGERFAAILLQRLSRQDHWQGAHFPVNLCAHYDAIDRLGSLMLSTVLP
ncbi:hypothetical protein KUW09_09420 [Mameliella alba]|nr:hypothetical protein [Antarctobacter heliothermus]MBY6144258.1 hypothetical protein [Mameliella alba]MCA0954307.1 hypothetical protein [Mameliella alba]